MPHFRKGERWNSGGGTKIRWGSLFKLFLTMMRSDVVFFLGAIRPMPWQILLLASSCLLRKKIFVASEGVRRGSVTKLSNAFFAALSPHFTLLAMGSGCEKDFRHLGFSGECLKFSFYESYPEVERPISDEKYSTNEVRILLVGRLIKRKNFELVLSSLQNYRGSKNIRVDIAGDGELRDKLAAIARELMKNKNISVIFHGHVEVEDLNKLFASATLFVCPSLYEGWGVVLNNALHYGLPILALNSVRSAEGFLVINDVNGKISTLDSFNNDLLKMVDSDLSCMSYQSFKLNEQWRLDVASSRFMAVVKSGAQFSEGVFSDVR